MIHNSEEEVDEADEPNDEPAVGRVSVTAAEASCDGENEPPARSVVLVVGARGGAGGRVLVGVANAWRSRATASLGRAVPVTVIMAVDRWGRRDPFVRSSADGTCHLAWKERLPSRSRSGGGRTCVGGYRAKESWRHSRAPLAHSGRETRDGSSAGGAPEEEAEKRAHARETETEASRGAGKR